MATSGQSPVNPKQQQTPVDTGTNTDFLIIGAGPFGLAMAAQAQRLGVDHVVIGYLMSFWREHMPKGMLLRSGCDWHLDPTGQDTIARFAETRGQRPQDLDPLTLEFYLEYADWFQKVKGIRVQPLLAEAGATAVYVCHRHDTPDFVVSDWSWLDPLLERIGTEPDWYRGLPESEKKALNDRFWAEGRLRLEPWLGPRVRHDRITVFPRTHVVGCHQEGTTLRVRLDSQRVIDVDHALFATGYKVDLQRVSLLRAGNLLDRIACRDGSPVLDDSLQTSVPGLFITSLPAARDFGLFFAFTAAVRASAHLVGRALEPQVR